jgi:ABC-type dipeptide/oligopeptide/nickel transport system permease component
VRSISLTPTAVRSVVAKLGQTLFVMIAVTAVAFLLLRLIPGDPAQVMLGDTANSEDVERLRKTLGLDRTLPEQFVTYLGGVVQGDLGTSLRTRQPVIDLVAARLPPSIALTAVALLITVAVALPLGVGAALHRKAGHAFQLVTAILIATPVFFSGLLLIYVFSINLGIAPIAGYRGGFPENLYYLWLPALTINLVLVPVIARLVYASVLRTLDEEFVEAAIVRGVPRRRMLIQYFLKPSLTPVIAALGAIAGGIITYSVIIEIVFNIPGIGSALVEAVRIRDYTVVQGLVLLGGLLVVTLNLLADGANFFLDPRTRRS